MSTDDVDPEFAALLEQSSLGTPQARVIRAMTADDDMARNTRAACGDGRGGGATSWWQAVKNRARLARRAFTPLLFPGGLGLILAAIIVAHNPKVGVLGALGVTAVAWYVTLTGGWPRWQPVSPERGVVRPDGARLVAPDGQEYPCEVRRDPQQDYAGMTVWVAVPRGELPEGPAEGWRVAADRIPAQSVLKFTYTVVTLR